MGRESRGILSESELVRLSRGFSEVEGHYLSLVLESDHDQSAVPLRHIFFQLLGQEQATAFNVIIPDTNGMAREPSPNEISIFVQVVRHMSPETEFLPLLVVEAERILNERREKLLTQVDEVEGVLDLLALRR
jgi:hypothetical protein